MSCIEGITDPLNLVDMAREALAALDRECQRGRVSDDVYAARGILAMMVSTLETLERLRQGA